MPVSQEVLNRLPPGHAMRRRFDREASLPTPEQLIAQYTRQIDERLDVKARELQYRDIVSAVTYRGDTNPVFAAEAEALYAWRSALWTAATDIMTEVLAGKRHPPADFAALWALLPVFVPPAP